MTSEPATSNVTDDEKSPELSPSAIPIRYAIPVIALDDTVEELDADVVVGELDLAAGRIIVPSVVYDYASSSGSMDGLDAESDDPVFDLEDDEDLYQEFREMNKFECKCAAVVIGTLLFAVLCLVIGVAQIDYYMGETGALQQSIAYAEETLTAGKYSFMEVVDNVSSTVRILKQVNGHEETGGLNYINFYVKLTMDIVTKLDEHVDDVANKFVERAESVGLCAHDEKSKEDLADSLKTFVMGVKGVKEAKILRKAKKLRLKNQKKDL